jgi:hypothetical protein
MTGHEFLSKRTYVLDADHTVRAQPDVAKWAIWMDNAQALEVILVGLDEVSDDLAVSTVFLGLDHGHRKDEVPVLFETALLQGSTVTIAQRYRTWEEAKEGHLFILEVLRKDGGRER